MNYSFIDELVVKVIIDNYFNALEPDPLCGQRIRPFPPISSPIAEHGLSLFIEGKKDNKNFSLLFDCGTNSSNLISNLKNFNISLKDLKAIALSHNHFDHWGGLIGLLDYLSTFALNKIPIYIGNKFFNSKFFFFKKENSFKELGSLKREEIEERKNFELIEVGNIKEIFPGLYLVGNIKNYTDYEKPSPDLFIEQDGKKVVDTFSEEIALFSIFKNKGLMIISGCAHRGIINTIKHIQNLTQVKEVYAILGGFHLVNASLEKIQRTVEDLKQISPSYLIPMHCTGFEALTILATELKEKFILNTVGSVYIFK